jgi:hypothetical protein
MRRVDRGTVIAALARDQKHLEVREAVPVVPVVGNGRSTDEDRTSRNPALLFGCNVKVKFLDREPYRLLGGGLPQKHEAPATQADKRDRAAKLGQERP